MSLRKEKAARLKVQVLEHTLKLIGKKAFDDIYVEDESSAPMSQPSDNSWTEVSSGKQSKRTKHETSMSVQIMDYLHNTKDKKQTPTKDEYMLFLQSIHPTLTRIQNTNRKVLLRIQI